MKNSKIDINISSIENIVKNMMNENWPNEMNNDYEGGDFDRTEFDTSARDAAKEDLGNEFSDLGDNKFEKNIDDENFKADIERTNLRLPNEEAEIEQIARRMAKRSAEQSSHDKDKKRQEDLFGVGSMNESGQGLFKPQDSKGNDINLKNLVISNDGSGRKGRVVGFGDDGSGNIQVRVNFAFPIDLKFKSPESMGKKLVSPSEITVIEPKPVEEETIEETRGLSATVKNTGDRNIKRNPDHSRAPIINLSESDEKSIEENIKTLSESKTITRKDIREFIQEQAIKISNEA